MTTMSASGVFWLADGWKNTTSATKLHNVKTISGTSLWEWDAATKCSLHKGTTSMQILPLCYLHLVAASRSYTCAQDGLDTVQLALVVFFHPSASENTPLSLMVVTTCCNLRCIVVFYSIYLLH